MMLKTVIIPILLILSSVFFLLNCVAEEQFDSKMLYAATAIILIALLLANTRL